MDACARARSERNVPGGVRPPTGPGRNGLSGRRRIRGGARWRSETRFGRAAMQSVRPAYPDGETVRRVGLWMVHGNVVVAVLKQRAPSHVDAVSS
ncbi:MAG: hypothetical protein D6725_08725 [Planctomycetota bacterium]|nr:MAG: hypothetical protein D6725_08725 [Planctomycetota bacterium]